MRFLNLIILALILTFSLKSSSAKTDKGYLLGLKKGLNLYKKANCSSCHQWHGNGGNSHGGVAASLRSTELNKNELILVIRCGILGSNMPYFSKNKKIVSNCYGEDSNFIERGLIVKASKFLRDDEIELLADFIITNFKNKKVEKKYCEEYFQGKSKICDKL